MKTKKVNFEAVTQTDGSRAVKFKYGNTFYTVADTFCTPKTGDTMETAELIAKLLNEHFAK